MAEDKTPAECTRMCVKDGVMYALAVDKKLYTLEGHEAELSKHSRHQPTGHDDHDEAQGTDSLRTLGNGSRRADSACHVQSGDNGRRARFPALSNRIILCGIPRRFYPAILPLPL